MEVIRHDKFGVNVPYSSLLPLHRERHPRLTTFCLMFTSRWALVAHNTMHSSFSLALSLLSNLVHWPFAAQQADLHIDNCDDTAICVKDSLLMYPGADGSLVVWNMESQKELGRLAGHDQQYTAAAAWGNMAVSVQDDWLPRLWNLEALQCTATLTCESILNSACCMEGRVLLGSTHGAIELWDVAANVPVALPDLEGHAAPVLDIKGSASVVLSGSSDKTARLWDLRTGECVRTMEGHTEFVASVDMDGQCRTAVSGSGDTTVRLWDLGSGRCMATFEGHSRMVRDVVMHESGGSFLSFGRVDAIVNAWDVRGSEAIMRADVKAFLPPGGRGSRRLFASKDLSAVACCSITSGTILEFRWWKKRRPEIPSDANRGRIPCNNITVCTISRLWLMSPTGGVMF